MSASIWLTVTLTIWLLITIVRQVFDLIGKLWIPVGFNLLQILCCITGLFGVCQRRVFLLIALTISTVISICQNVLIFLWYIGVFGDISRPVLSAGLPYSYSFFLKHTPSCGARFDLQRSKWVQLPCIVPYNQIEAGQALLHIILAGITLILSIVVVLERKRDKDRLKPPQSVQYAQIKRNQLPPPLTISELGSGYVNSSSDDMTATTVTLPEQRAVPPFSYERHNRNKRARIRPNSMPQPYIDQYSCMTASERENFSTKLPTRRSTSSVTNGRFRKSSDQPSRVMVHEDLKVDDVPNEQEFGRPPGTLTSLISFDPKSRTLLRVREHRESDEDDAEGYSRIGKECPVDSGLYERISVKPRNRPTVFPALQKPDNSRLQNLSHSHDSIPTTIAPVLVTENPDPNRSDPNFTQSPYRRPLPSTSPQQMDHHISPETRAIESPGIRFMHDEDYHPRAGTSGLRSNFHDESNDGHTVIGHYHSIREYRLTNRPPSPTMPVITGTGLL
ncbi:hypothetical protein V3C99_010911, partial [Haemonchus contortus]